MDQPPAPSSTKLEFRALTPDCDRKAFSCGKPEIDGWFREKSLKKHEKYLYRVTTAHLAGNSSPAGYYALTVARGDRDHLKNEAKNYGFDGDFFPSVHLHYLAMFSNLQRQGFGSRVLMHAIERVYKISRYAGAYTMTLVSLDEKSTAFYQSLGFETYGPASQHPLMLLPIQSIVDLVEGTRPWPRALAPMLAAADAAKAAS